MNEAINLFHLIIEFTDWLQEMNLYTKSDVGNSRIFQQFMTTNGSYIRINSVNSHKLRTKNIFNKNFYS
jgi:hypothetical protein